MGNLKGEGVGRWGWVRVLLRLSDVGMLSVIVLSTDKEIYQAVTQLNSNFLLSVELSIKESKASLKRLAVKMF